MPGLLITEGSPKNDAAKSENFWFARYNLDPLPLSQNWQCSLAGELSDGIGLMRAEFVQYAQGGCFRDGQFQNPRQIMSMDVAKGGYLLSSRRRSLRLRGEIPKCEGISISFRNISGFIFSRIATGRRNAINPVT